MAWAHVQSAGANGATVTVSSTTAGNLEVFGLFWSDSANTNPTITGFTAAAAKITDGGNYSTQVFYRENSPGSQTSIAVASWSSSTPGSIRVRFSEYSGIATSSALTAVVRQIQTSPGTATDAVTSGTVAVNTVPALLWGMTDAPGIGTNLDPGTGWTQRATDDGGVVMDRNETSTGSYAALATANSNPARVHTWMLAFQEAGAGGSSIVPGGTQKLGSGFSGHVIARLGGALE